MEQQLSKGLAIDRDLIIKWLVSTEEGRRLNKEEGEYFVQVALLHNLNPFKRELHARLYDQQGNRHISLITGFEVYLSRAAASGLLDGFKTHIEGQGDDLKAVVEIYRKDWQHPFIHEAFFNEVAQRDESGRLFSFWLRAGRYMLRKVVLSQGFRLAFPEILAGLPYESAELPFEGNSLPATPSVSPEHKHYEPQPIQAAVVSGSPIAESPAVTASRTQPDKVETIKQLMLDNRSKLEDTHVEWIIDQLRQPKSDRQLDGLLKHVQKAITENKPAQSAIRQPANVRRFPRDHGGRQPFPRRTEQTNPTAKASGAEDLIF
ncbi:MAG: hypothetical protein A2087_09330 [Spirochaetes bacterium GWD1_61_31]|nr:MAG: hypothetical protein A2087_09330 [Spirochaetes bacterium GWD1_61_31]